MHNLESMLEIAGAESSELFILFAGYGGIPET